MAKLTVDEERHGGKSRCLVGSCQPHLTVAFSQRAHLVTSVLSSDGSEHGHKFASKGAGLPESSASVEKGRHLGGHAAVPEDRATSQHRYYKARLGARLMIFRKRPAARKVSLSRGETKI